MMLKKRFEFNFGPFQTSLNFITGLFTLLVLVLLLSLSAWQYQRGVHKLKDLHAFHQTGLHHYRWSDKISNHQHLSLQGYYLNEHQFLLDNQFYRHRFGYHVITPLLLQTGQIVLVDRGFISGGVSRTELPKIMPVAGLQTLSGRVHYVQANRFISNHVIDNPGQSPLVIEQVDFGMIGTILHKPLAPWLIWLDSDQEHGFSRHWQVVTMTPERHFAYAFQWFLLAGGFLTAMIVANTRKT